MQRTFAATVLLSLMSCLGFADKTLHDGLLAHWNFDEGSGIVAQDASPSKNHAILNNAQWVKGPFGKAAKFNGNNSYAMFSPPQKLRNAPEMTFAAWVLWEGTGKYPCIIHCGWNPGGFMMFVNQNSVGFRMGKPGKEAWNVNRGWQESGAWGISKLPMRKWTHLAATFKRPILTMYVNGRKTSTATWDYPVDFNADVASLGAWMHQPKTHQGLLDDVRLYSRILTPQEIRQLADRTNRNTPDYEVIPDLKQKLVALSVENKHATLNLNPRGEIVSLKLKENGRELIKSPTPLGVILRNKEPFLSSPYQLEVLKDNVIALKYFGIDAHIKLKIVATEHYFKIIPLQVQVPELKSLTLCCLKPTMDQYLGSMIGMISDEQDAVCIRSLGLNSTVRVEGPRQGRNIKASTGPDKFHPVAIAAAPRKNMIPILQNMQTNENVPKSSRGGAWALTSEATRASYLFADLRLMDVDGWIDVALRGGFKVIHLHGWWKTLGHYDVNRRYFPQGLKDMQEAVRKIHAAGLQATFHTLTACIAINDDWVEKKPAKDFIPFATYTLAQPMTKDDDTIYVEELPIKKHDRVFTYSGNGNAIKIDDEIILYAEISREKPYAFRKCKRGAFKTKPAPHHKGVKADYLQQRYLAFYPQPDSKLADQLAQNIADKYNALKLNGLYFDGSEGMMSRYGVDAMRWKIFQKLKYPGTTESSTWGHNNWWFHTRLGAWDYPVWSFRTNVDAHVAHAKDFPKNNLLRAQMGWWAPTRGGSRSRAQFTDEFEYFAAKTHGIDASMSLSGISPKGNNERIMTMLTTLGWHERMRLAQYFTPEDREKIAEPKQDVIVRLTPTGQWKLFQKHLDKKRLVSLAPGNATWQAQNPFHAQPLHARIEALYTPNTKSPVKHTIIQVTDPKNLTVRNSAHNVEFKTQALEPDPQAPFKKLRFVATNKRDTARGAWLQAGNTYDFPYLNLKGCNTFGIWIKGDGSGALLNLQFNSPNVFHRAISDHYINIDFTGWKFVTLLLRERDADRMLDYVWPYPTNPAAHSTTRNSVVIDHVSAINVFLNNLPPKKTTTIEIGDIQGFPQSMATLVNPTLTVNGTAIRFPVTMNSGQYLELTPQGQASVFDPNGTLIAHLNPQYTYAKTTAQDGDRKPDQQPPLLLKGDNHMTLNVDSLNGTPRAEVTLFSLGKPFGTRAEKVKWDYLDREYELPKSILALDGKDNVWQLIRRDEHGQSPNDDPKLELKLRVASAGLTATQQTKQGQTFVDACDNQDNYKLSNTNNYAKYAFDAEGAGTAKAGVTFKVQKTNSSISKDGAIQFSAVSSRSDSMGWAAIGRKFDRPLDLSKAKSLTLQVKGFLGTSILKIQLRDVKGMWHDMIVPQVGTQWGIAEFNLADANLDLSKIEYILYYFNGLSADQKPVVYIDNVAATAMTAKLDTPILTIGNQDLIFPCTMETGDYLTCLDQRNWTLYNRSGKVKAQGKLTGNFPKLKPGANPIKLNFKKHTTSNLKLNLEITKHY